MNKDVDQHNPYVLVVMSLAVLLVVLQKHHLGKPSNFKWFDLFFKKKSQDLCWHKDFPNYFLKKTMGIYSLVWSHYFCKLPFYKHLVSGFQTPLRKIGKGDVSVPISLWIYLQNLYFLIFNSFHQSQRHDPLGALFRPLFLWCLLHEFDYD
jgi:hypothetical protein